MARPPHPLRLEFETALLAHIEAHGDDFARQPLVLEWGDRGVSPAAAYRWIASVVDRRRVNQPRRGTSTSAVAPPVAVPQTVDTPAAPFAVQKLPPVPKIDDVARMGMLPVLELLRQCVSTVQDMMKHARMPDGSVRNIRVLQAASEHLRKVVETAAKLNESIAAQQDMQEFHKIVMAEISAEAPVVQERILARIKRATDAELKDTSI